MEQLNSLLNKLEKSASVYHLENNTISKSNVGWHIVHSLKVIVQIVDTLEKSDPAAYKWRFNTWRIIVLTLKKIPRGRGKAPKSVLPDNEINNEIIEKALSKARAAITKMAILNSNHFFKHPYFGDLNLKPTATFLVIHTNHHLKIINDIVKTSN